MEMLDYLNSTKGKIDLRDGSADFMREIKQLYVVGNCFSCKHFELIEGEEGVFSRCVEEESPNFGRECPPDDTCKLWKPRK